MRVDAVLFGIFNIILLYGGLAVCIIRAIRSKRPVEE